MPQWLLSPQQYQRLIDSLVQVTIPVLLLSFLLGIVLAVLVGVARLSDRKWVRGAALLYVEFARGISSVILLFIMARAIPILVFGGGVRPPLLLLASLALGINMGGYGAEIVRGAIQSIPGGQTEAAIALNLTPTDRLRVVILPQAMRIILPPMGNLTIEILKGTALVALVGLTDVMRATQSLETTQLARGVTGITLLFINALLIYFVLAQAINGLFRLAERRVLRRYERRRGDVPVVGKEVAA